MLPVCVSFNLTTAPMSPAANSSAGGAVAPVEEVNLADALGRSGGRRCKVPCRDGRVPE